VKHHVILNVVSRLFIPIILVFALYVQFHGDFGPGGGFQAGVIFGTGFILYALVFGLEAAREAANPGALVVLMPAGVLLYAGVGVASLFLEGNFLDYAALSQDPVHGQHLGILLIELGVGVTVASVMIIIFVAFAGRGRRGES
jgi:multicomponent Na+:H+ antiporter subunit B